MGHREVDADENLDRIQLHEICKAVAHELVDSLGIKEKQHFHIAITLNRSPTVAEMRAAHSNGPDVESWDYENNVKVAAIRGDPAEKPLSKFNWA